MVSAPLFAAGGPWARPRARISRQASLRGRLDPVLVVELAVGCDQGAGAAHDEGDLVVAVALVGEENDTCECRDVVLNGTERVIETAGDLVGLEALEVESHGLDAVSLAGADVLLLTAAGDVDAALAKGLDIAHDGADAAVEQAEGEVLVAEQAALVAGLGGHAKDAGAAQAVDAMSEADLMSSWAASRVSRTVTFWHWSRGLPAGSVAATTRSLIWPRPSWSVGVVGVEREDLLDGVEDGLGDEGGAVGSLFDPTPEHAVESLGIEPSLTQLCLRGTGFAS